MTTPLVIEHESDADFLTQLEGIVDAAIEEQDEAVITISSAVQTTGQSNIAVLEASLNGHENISLEVPLDNDKMLDIVDWASMKFGHISEFPAFAYQQLTYLIQNSGDTDIRHDVIQDQIARLALASAEYNGLLNQLQVNIHGDESMSISFSVFASVTADTSAQEREVLRSKGLEDLQHPVSSPYKLIPVLEFTTATIKKLV